jgi:Flp pilus assembly protein protease CpaA
VSLLLLATDLLLAATLTICAWSDLRSRLIYDVVTLPALAAGLVLQAVRHGWGEGWAAPGLAGGFAAVGLSLALFGLFHATGGLGAGDVKLVMAVGAIVGMPAVLGALVFGTLAGGVQGLLALAARTRPGRRLCAKLGMTGTRDESFGRTIPLGVGLSVGIAAFWMALRLGVFEA